MTVTVLSTEDLSIKTLYGSGWRKRCAQVSAGQDRSANQSSVRGMMPCESGCCVRDLFCLYRGVPPEDDACGITRH